MQTDDYFEKYPKSSKFSKKVPNSKLPGILSFYFCSFKYASYGYGILFIGHVGLKKHVFGITLLHELHKMVPLHLSITIHVITPIRSYIQSAFCTHDQSSLFQKYTKLNKLWLTRLIPLGAIHKTRSHFFQNFDPLPP